MPPINPSNLNLDLKLPRPPFWMIAGFLILVVLTWLPLVLIARSRVTLSDKPRVHIFHDMDHQPKLKPQDPSVVFADGRAMRPDVPGTVARGELRADDHYERGFTLVPQDDGSLEARYFEGLPEGVELNQALMLRGQKAFQTFCFPCHGADGYGNGPVHVRATELGEPAWIPPTSLHTDTVRDRADGHLFNTISNGIRNMPAYGSQIKVADRWAIVAYLRALQRSQNATMQDVPADRRGTLR